MTNQQVEAALLAALKPYLLAYCQQPGAASLNVDVKDEYAWVHFKLSPADYGRINNSLDVKNAMNDALQVLCNWLDPEVTRTSFGVVPEL